MKRTIRRLMPAAAVTTLAATIVAVPSAASAATPPKDPAACLKAVQDWTVSNVDGRLAHLDVLDAALQAAGSVTAAHRAALTESYASARTGLPAVESAVLADTECAEARADARAVVDDYRIYLVLTPQTHLTIAADRGIAGEARLDAAALTLQKAIDSAAAAGRDVGAAQAAQAELLGDLQQARAAFDGVADDVLAQTPAGYPGNSAVFSAARTEAQQGRQALAEAARDAKAVREALRAIA
jgi:hypothetical protein